MGVCTMGLCCLSLTPSPLWYSASRLLTMGWLVTAWYAGAIPPSRVCMQDCYAALNPQNGEHMVGVCLRACLLKNCPSRLGVVAVVVVEAG